MEQENNIITNAAAKIWSKHLFEMAQEHHTYFNAFMRGGKLPYSYQPSGILEIIKIRWRVLLEDITDFMLKVTGREEDE